MRIREKDLMKIKCQTSGSTGGVSKLTFDTQHIKYEKSVFPR